MSLADWAALGIVALVGVVGFLAGALWQSKLHLRDLRSHAKWTDEYTCSVVKLLDDLAEAFASKGREP